MKKIVAIVLGALLFSCAELTGPSTIDYNNTLVDQQIVLVKQVDALYNELGAEETTELIPVYNKTKEVAKETITFAKALEPFRGDSSFKIAFVDFAKGFNSFLNDDFAILIKNRLIPDSSYTIEDEDEYNTIINKVDKRQGELEDNFIDVQEAYASKYNMRIEK